MANVNKVNLGNRTLIDISDTTATASTVKRGYKLYGANGDAVIGEAPTEIHELNNFSGTLDSDTYLAVDDGAGTGKVTMGQFLAGTDARIDNIIAGPAPSAQEVTDARLGDDGVVYPSLGDAIRDQVGDLKSAFKAKIIGTANLLNIDKNTLNAYIKNTNGELAAYNGWQASEFIAIEPNTTYNFVSWNSAKWVIPTSVYYAFYDGAKQFTHGGITGTSSGWDLVSVSGDAFVRVSAQDASMSTNKPMLGTSADIGGLIDSTDVGAYIAYGNTLLKDTLKDYVDKAIVNIDGMIALTKNLLDSSTNKKGYYINSGTGAETAYSGWEASDYIKVAPDTDYRYIFWMSATHWACPDSVYYAFYDANKTYTHGGTTGTSLGLDILSNSNDAYVRISYASSRGTYGMFGYKSIMEPLIDSTDINEYEPQGTKVINDILKPVIESVTEAEILLPSTLYVAVGRQITLYKENVIKSNNPNNFILYWYTDISSNGYDQDMRFTPTAGEVGTHTLSVWVYNAKTGELLNSKTITLEVVADTARTAKKVLFIGDSLTASGFYPYEIQKHLSNEGVESIGTMSTTAYLDSDPAVTTQVTVYHEGRGGWSAKDYTTKASKNGVSNAFWNPSSSKFDFSYYLTNNNYSLPDVVCVNLGTNGTSDVDGEISAIKEIVASIRTASGTVPIIVSAVANGSDTDSAYLNIYLTKIREKQLEEFDDTMSDVIVAPIYLNLSGKYDFRTETVAESTRNPIEVVRQINNVHPSKYGYFKFADVYWSAIQAVL